jgi:RNA polymerase sigma-70 factor (ECF subfamily)
MVLDNERIIRLAIQKNPQEGFELLFKRYYKPLCSHAIRYVYSRAVAEDIVSEIFTTLWVKKLYQNINKSSYRTYLYQALRNSIRNYLDKEFREKEHQRKIETSNQSELEKNTPQAILLFDELVIKIQVAVESLPPQCQKVFILSRIHGKKNNEIAQELQIKIKTVEAHMMKALFALRSIVQSYL